MEDDERLVFRVATPWFWWTVYDPSKPWTVFGVLNVLIFLLVSPLLLVIALVAALFSKPIDRSPEEVARYLEEMAHGKGDLIKRDEFESVPIANRRLDALRVEASELHPLNEHRAELLELAARARELQ